MIHKNFKKTDFTLRDPLVSNLNEKFQVLTENRRETRLNMSRKYFQAPIKFCWFALTEKLALHTCPGP